MVRTLLPPMQSPAATTTIACREEEPVTRGTQRHHADNRARLEPKFCDSPSPGKMKTGWCVGAGSGREDSPRGESRP